MLKQGILLKRWIGTLNNPDVTVMEAFLEQWVTRHKATYACGQLEKGKEGTPHLQFALNFHKGIRLTALKKLCGKSHFEPVEKDNGIDAYCMKVETRLEGPWEFGVRPVVRNSKTDWARVRAHAVSGELSKIPDDVFVKHYNSLTRIAKDNMPVPKYRGKENPKVCIWLWGESRSGKSTLARTGDYYLKLGNKWWDGYQGQKHVVLDDLGKDAAKALTDKIKLWCDDHFDQTGETKGGAIPLTYDVFTVTANWHPSEVWSTMDDLNPILNRFKIVDKMVADTDFKKDDQEKIVTVDDVRNLYNKKGF